MTEFMAHYERKLSDGDYGSEGLSMSWTWSVDDDETGPGESLDVAVEFLRTLVLRQLSKSAAERVRFAASRELKARDNVPVDAPPHGPTAYSDTGEYDDGPTQAHIEDLAF